MTQQNTPTTAPSAAETVTLTPGGSVDALLVANFTHQIINPLNGVLGTINNLIKGTIVAQRRDQRLKVVQAQISHIIELVRNLAYLSQITTSEGRESLKNLGQRTLVPRIILEAAMFFQEMARQRGMEINLTDKVTRYTVKGPPDLLRQVFTNLFENAVKYADPGTIVWITPHAQKKTKNLLIEVTNVGPGFEPSEHDAIFQRGYRGKAAKDISASGSGIGLFICREILDIGFGAAIDAEHSTRQRKTTFRIRFPAFQIPPATDEDQGEH
jgi:signal transduction histidine kinase